MSEIKLFSSDEESFVLEESLPLSFGLRSDSSPPNTASDPSTLSGKHQPKNKQEFSFSGYFLHCHSSDVPSAPAGAQFLWLIFSTAAVVMFLLLLQELSFFGYFLHCHSSDVPSATVGAQFLRLTFLNSHHSVIFPAPTGAQFSGKILSTVAAECPLCFRRSSVDPSNLFSTATALISLVQRCESPPGQATNPSP
ncbi:hypothetical protein DPX16_3953 [Anabarilius grahami]|uniref:Uncharacterized protein n=1 Tax=Anabarilius grahami TaxID=495550 RepID=A0A3N0XKE5_ANAGA|nr:hypothetical protein DPX16_3953 [Anabarilius grahami]